MQEEIEVFVRFTPKQVSYIRQYLSHPTIPDAKDLEVAFSIQDILASAIQQAERDFLKKQKALEIGETIAKLIIGATILDRKWYSEDELKNLMRRAISFQMVRRDWVETHQEIVITHPVGLSDRRFLVHRNWNYGRLQVWEKPSETTPYSEYPWNLSDIPRPLVEMDMDSVDGLMEKYKHERTNVFE